VTARAATVLLPAALLAAAAWTSGGYFPRTWGALLLVAAIAVAAVGLLSPRLRAGRLAWLPVAGLLALAAWQLASRAWAVAPDAAVLEAERTLVYAAAAAALLLLVPRERAGALVAAVLLGTATATVGGLLEHVLSPGAPTDRLEQPVGYPNASGILATTALLLGLGLAAHDDRLRRALGALAVPPAAAALYLSLSRGSVLVAALGVVVLALTARSSAGLARLALPLAVAAAAVAFAAGPGSFEEPRATGAELASLLAVGLLALCSGALALLAPRLRLPAVPRRVALALAIGAVLSVVAAVVVVGAREVRQIRSVPAAQQGAPDRLLSTSTSSRAEYWDVAASMASREPLVGEGAGSFERVWVRERPALLFVRDAHNLYLETLAEVGPVGLALLLVALVAPLAAARHALPSTAGRAAFAAYVALLAHAVLDWDWELPAVALCTIGLGVALLRLGGGETSRPLSRRASAGLLAGAAALATVAIVAHAGNGAAAEANDALDRGDAAVARREAERARRFTPWAAEPWQLLGEAELAAGRTDLARAHLRRAVREDPASWRAWLALVFAAEGDEQARALARARALNPLAPELDAVASAYP
jgi:tetratricopeptide (TPR) repeat protein